MRVPLSSFGLPSYLLVLFLQAPEVTQSQQLQWPYNLPPHEKYYPENEELVKRNIDILQKLQQQPVVGVRKMSADPGEKFYLDYWSFEGHDDGSVGTSLNATILKDFHAPVALHSDISKGNLLPIKRYLRLPIYGQDLFSKRDFMCPTGTESCSSISRPNSCCPTSSTCQIVPDTGLGDVGCCDATQICAGSLSNCPSGYSSCPNNPGGGCCLPGYACYQEGCVLTSTTVVVVSPSTSTSSTPTISPSTVIATSVVIVTESTSPTTSTTSTSSSASVTSSEAAPLTTTTITTQSTASATTFACSSSFRSCPASLGGGCCATDRACGSDFCPALSSSASLAPPVRPTTDTSLISTSATVSSVVGCPTGFYACSAYYQGGCCQVGRDCAQTSCPASSQATVVSSNGVTAVAPAGTYLSGSTTLLTGTCATGWFSCAATNGGGCCPSGYACGTAACSATASGGQGNQVGKIAPNGSSATVTLSTMMLMFGVSITSLVAMIVL